jgi:TetR/AcrR family transcriptional regulator, cholesterol catabolism regulator
MPAALQRPSASSIAVQPKPPSKRPRGRPRKTLDERDDGNRRLALISAAAKLFRRKGFHATTTRDIAAAVDMHSGSPFYHFKTKEALLHAVMDEGMQSALAQQTALPLKTDHADHAQQALSLLIRNHFGVLLGARSDFIPVMLYEWRCLNTRQRNAVKRQQSAYEAVWLPVLQALHDQGQLRADVHLARLLIFGALNWSAQWYSARKASSLDDLTAAAMALFIHSETA